MASAQPVVFAGPRLHVVVVTFPSFGHIIPMLELARKISKFHTVTFVVAASKIPEMMTRELIQPGNEIKFHGLPDAVFAGYLDENAFEEGGFARMFEAILPPVAEFFRVMPTRKDAGKLEGMEPVDVVIADFFLGDKLNTCHERGVPFYIFNTANAWELHFLLTLNEDTPTVADHLADMFQTLPQEGVPPPPVGESMKALFLPMKNYLWQSAGVIVNSFRDIEVETLRLIETDPQLAGMQIYCVGPLLDESSKKSSASKLAMEKNVADWLDRQSANSVVYFSFGSVTTPIPAQLKTIGQALLQLGRPFIWAMRERFYSALPEEISSKISTQFDEADSKFLILNWAPQKTILGHKAVSVFVSHCGWNSTLESMASGKPIVGWPMFADQRDNAEWVAKSGAGLCIPDTGMNCLRMVPIEEINDAIGKVGGGKDGKDTTYLAEARKWETKIKATWSDNGSSNKEFLELIKFGRSK